MLGRAQQLFSQVRPAGGRIYQRWMCSEGGPYEHLIVEARDKVGIITLNRPSALNALNDDMCGEIVTAIKAFDKDASIGAMVLTGSERAFAAGADIKEMASNSYTAARFKHDRGAWIQAVSQCDKPTVCAVRGYALGGGCELAMACDILLASDDAQFGQPEVQIATIPGWGGTQRLVRAIGKAKAMEMILTGRRMKAAEAESAGLVARVVPGDQLVEEAIKVAETIASYSKPIVSAAKECVLAAADMSLRDGLLFERRQFQATFATEDQKEGMKAFMDKRTPEWRDK